MVNNSTIAQVAALIFALVSFSLLIAVGVAFWWQEKARSPDREVVYGIEDALDYVMGRLSPAARAAVRRADVRRILEWELRYLQDPALRHDEAAVVGGLQAAQFAQDQALAQGYPYEPEVIIEVLDLQAAYLSELGAVGDPVSAEESHDIIERWEEQE